MSASKFALLGKASLAAVLAAVLFTAPAFARDDNPPGPAGGPGTNWENKPGPQGGPGTSPDLHYGYWHGHYYYRIDNRWHLWNVKAKCWYPDPDHNPPGPARGKGTNWENAPGPKGGPGASPDKYGRCR